jgi:hypothetical protein
MKAEKILTLLCHDAALNLLYSPVAFLLFG